METNQYSARRLLLICKSRLLGNWKSFPGHRGLWLRLGNLQADFPVFQSPGGVRVHLTAPPPHWTVSTLVSSLTSVAKPSALQDESRLRLGPGTNG